MLYLITYDKTIEKKELIEAIQTFDGWWHYLETTWIVSTKDNADAIFDKLKSYVPSPGRILIVKINSDMQGLLPKEAWDWINDTYQK